MQIDLFNQTEAKVATAQKKPIIQLTERRVRNSVEAYMAEKKLNKTAMSRKAGMSYQYFLQIMNGKQNISPKAAINLLHACEGKVAASQRKK